MFKYEKNTENSREFVKKLAEKSLQIRLENVNISREIVVYANTFSGENGIYWKSVPDCSISSGIFSCEKMKNEFVHFCRYFVFIYEFAVDF